ncbi:thioredoxin domain-containing protein 11-like [Styela clava]
MDLLKFGKYILIKMRKYHNVIGLILVFFILLLRFIPSMNENPQQLETRSAKPPTSVTSNGSKIFDSWTGNLKLRDVIFDHSEVTVVFYYAPWCVRSMDALRELEDAASVLHKQVSFVAVNCWWNQGDCRGHFQFFRFPQIYIHHKNLRKSVLYDGPLKKKHFIYFLNEILNPLTYLSTKLEVEKFMFENQFTVLSHINPSHDKDLMFYSVLAIRQLEMYDHPVQFGLIVENQLAKSYFLRPNILQVRNKMKPREIVHLEFHSTIDQIIQSLKKFQSKLISPDIDLPGVKTNYLYQTIHKGPTLIVFISSENLETRELFIKKIRHLVFQYRRCPEISEQTKQIYAHTLSPENKCCQSVLFEDSNFISLVCSICVKQGNPNKSYYAECGWIRDYISSVAIGNDKWIRYAQEKISFSTNSVLCTNFLRSYDTHRVNLGICCEAKDNILENSEKISEKQEICIDELLNKTQKLSLISTDNGETVIRDTSGTDNSIIFTDNNPFIIDNCTDSIISGIYCKTNRTLQLLTLDLERHKALSRNLGVNEENVYHIGETKIGAVIFDPFNDFRHVMTSSHFHLENFIINYTLGILPQTYHATSLKIKPCVPTSTSPCVHEITADSFEETVLNNKKDVFLFYYVPCCSACSSISHIYLTLAHLLHHTNPVILARIDAHENELPSHFTVQSYPTFMIFPAGRSADSSVFPLDTEITVARLLSFILKNGSIHTKFDVLKQLCFNGEEYPRIKRAACDKLKAMLYIS